MFSEAKMEKSLALRLLKWMIGMIKSHILKGIQRVMGQKRIPIHTKVLLQFHRII